MLIKAGNTLQLIKLLFYFTLYMYFLVDDVNKPQHLYLKITLHGKNTMCSCYAMVFSDISF